MESDLEFETQESRRAFLYALAVTDPNDQLPYVVAARQASQRVDQARGPAASAGRPGDHPRDVENFERAWSKYDQARDEIMALILEGTLGGGSAGGIRARTARVRGGARQLACAQGRAGVRAQTDSLQVNATLRRSIGGLAAFVLSTLLILGLLIKANRSRRQALESLHADAMRPWMRPARSQNSAPRFWRW